MTWRSWSTGCLNNLNKQQTVYKFVQRWCFFQNETRAIRWAVVWKNLTIFNTWKKEWQLMTLMKTNIRIKLLNVSMFP